MLKNDGLLPLNRAKIKRIAVIGTNANSVPLLLGNYNGTPSKPMNILDGIKSVAGAGIEVVYEPGCPLALRTNVQAQLDPDAQAKAVAAAKTADVVIYVGGISPQLEGEEMRVYYDGFSGGDRTRIELPALQTELLKALRATGKPVVLVNCSGSAVAMPWEAENLAAIVQAWYPGQAGGTAVADLLFGFSNPSGRLPVTFYRATEDLPPFEDYRMANRTHRYFTGQPLFPFGHGLSYTRFRYDEARLGRTEIGIDDTIHLSLNLVNTGERDGDEVVQVYARRLEANDPQLPRHTLCAFQRVAVPRGQRVPVELAVPARTLRRWDPQLKSYVVDPGTYELQIGASSEDIRISTSVRIKAGPVSAKLP